MVLKQHAVVVTEPPFCRSLNGELSGLWQYGNMKPIDVFETLLRTIVCHFFNVQHNPKNPSMFVDFRRVRLSTMTEKRFNDYNIRINQAGDEYRCSNLCRGGTILQPAKFGQYNLMSDPST